MKRKLLVVMGLSLAMLAFGCNQKDDDAAPKDDKAKQEKVEKKAEELKKAEEPAKEEQAEEPKKAAEPVKEAAPKAEAAKPEVENEAVPDKAEKLAEKPAAVAGKPAVIPAPELTKVVAAEAAPDGDAVAKACDHAITLMGKDMPEPPPADMVGKIKQECMADLNGRANKEEVAACLLKVEKVQDFGTCLAPPVAPAPPTPDEALNPEKDKGADPLFDKACDHALGVMKVEFGDKMPAEASANMKAECLKDLTSRPKEQADKMAICVLAASKAEEFSKCADAGRDKSKDVKPVGEPEAVAPAKEPAAPAPAVEAAPAKVEENK